jgi:hypothetical protein
MLFEIVWTRFDMSVNSIRCECESIRCGTVWYDDGRLIESTDMIDNTIGMNVQPIKGTFDFGASNFFLIQGTSKLFLGCSAMPAVGCKRVVLKEFLLTLRSKEKSGSGIL